MQPASRPRRRRRSADEAEREIVEAAEAFLRERPFRELTVDEVMRRTELSRPSFYIHFRDRHQLVLRVVACLRAELSEMSDRWYKGQGDGATLVREALEGVVGVYERNGPVVRALADAATDDPDIERVYSGSWRRSSTRPPTTSRPRSAPATSRASIPGRPRRP
jgi:AcrR family transcriptional regulator